MKTFPILPESKTKNVYINVFLSCLKKTKSLNESYFVHLAINKAKFIRHFIPTKMVLPQTNNA
jgi:hypothetical protein